MSPGKIHVWLLLCALLSAMVILGADQNSIKMDHTTITGSTVVIFQGVEFNLGTEAGVSHFIEAFKKFPDLVTKLETYLNASVDELKTSKTLVDMLNSALRDKGDLSATLDDLNKEKKRLTEELAALKKLHESDVGAALLLEQAEKALKDNDRQRARQLLRTYKENRHAKAALAVQEEAKATEMEAESFYTEGKYVDALATIKSAVDLNPHDFRLLAHTGDYALDEGEYTQAQDYYSRASSELEHGSDFNAANLSMLELKRGVVELRMWNLESAELHLTNALAHLDDDSKKPDVYTQLALVYREQGRLRMASDACSNSIVILSASAQSERKLAEAYENQGLLHKDAGDFSAAIQYFEKALKLNTDRFSAQHFFCAVDLNNLGTAYHEVGSNVLAEQFLRKALLIDLAAFRKDHPFVGRDQNNLGLVLVDLEQYGEAERLLSLAKQNVQTNFGTNHVLLVNRLNNLGYLYYNSGNNTNAELNFVEAIRLLKVNHRENSRMAILPFFNLATTCWTIGDNFKARCYATKANGIAITVFGLAHALTKNITSFINQLPVQQGAGGGGDCS